ncbi:MAG: hypothetical protein HN617_10325 [Planctomycetaceae bacterium]|nr:hypothetical protein [Planctomycetaceae bacterium]MBT7917932.1 hypothetical protein [Planctomycetaceae bacterium]
MLVPEAQHELTTPRIAPLCDPLGSPTRFVEADFPLFLNSDSGSMVLNVTVAADFLFSPFRPWTA